MNNYQNRAVIVKDHNVSNYTASASKNKCFVRNIVSATSVGIMLIIIKSINKQ